MSSARSRFSVDESDGADIEDKKSRKKEISMAVTVGAVIMETTMMYTGTILVRMCPKLDIDAIPLHIFFDFITIFHDIESLDY